MWPKVFFVTFINPLAAKRAGKDLTKLVKASIGYLYPSRQLIVS
jgi:hypothetical protein